MWRGRVLAMTNRLVSVKLDAGPVVNCRNALNHRNAPNATVLVVRQDNGEHAIVGRPR